MSMQSFCSGVRMLPPELRQKAAENAVRINPANDPGPKLQAMQAMGVPIDPTAIVIATGKHWGPKVDLGVTFLDTNNQNLKNKILEYANKWSKYGNIRFRESSDGEIRLATTPGHGHYTFLGTDIMLVQPPQNQKNMNLDSFSMATSNAEFDRVVCHEFGHVLACPHEQHRPEVMALLNRQRTIQYFAARGWSPQTTIQQIFTPLDMNSVWATRPDLTSIMCYQFPGECTENFQPIPGGLTINELDGELIAKHYPKTDVPDPPPSGKVVIDLTARTLTAPQGWTFSAATSATGQWGNGYSASAQPAAGEGDVIWG